MESVTLDVLVRSSDELGKNKADKLRRDGWVPGVVYGEKMETLSIKVGHQKLRKAVNEVKNHVLSLVLDDKKTFNVIVKDLILHPLKSEIVHVDFLQVDLKKEIETHVPLRLVGVSHGVKMGGTLIHNLHQVTVKCLPHVVPDYIDADVTGLELGKSLKIKDVSLPAGLTLLTTPEEIVAHCENPAGSAAE